jgi:hypothetical protein
MKGKFILISGSASNSCTEAKLDLAVEFVEHIVGEILRRGGGLVILASDDSATLDSRGVPRIFNWVALREVGRYMESTTEGSRKCVRIVMSDHVVESRLSESNLRTLSNLQQRGLVEVERIRREEYTGGRYRELQVELADAMVAVGGGKGTYICGTDLLGAGKPVLPIDLNIGAFSGDGDGALLLHRELMDDPVRFFLGNHELVMDRLDTLTLEREIHQVSAVAQRAAEFLASELSVEAQTPAEPAPRTRIRRFFSYVHNAVSNFVTWVGLARAIEFLKGL